MSDLDRNYVSPFGRAAGRVDAATVDAGLRSYMLRIYNYMSIGLAITGLAALGVYMAAVTTDQAGAAAKFGNAYLTQFGYAMYVSPLKWLFILAPLAMVFAISFGINRLRPATAQMLFWAFSALMGISLSSIFLVYTHTSIVRVFFITAATFGALSLYGYTTKRDMSGMGSFLFMGLIGSHRSHVDAERGKAGDRQADAHVVVDAQHVGAQTGIDGRSVNASGGPAERRYVVTV
jgi:FtsH-binding integral membrane protein